MSDLIEIKDSAVLEVFSNGNGLDDVINEIKLVVDGFEHDLSTAAGRKRTASLAHKVSKMKTRLDGMGKELVSEWKAKAKAVDSNRKKIREELDVLRDQARQPLTDWENAERERVENHTRNIELINDIACIHYEQCSNDIKSRIDQLSKIVIDESYEEFERQAIETRDKLLESLNDAYKRELKSEQERAELERLRKEAEEKRLKEEQERKEREEKERQERLIKEAEERAKREAEEEKARIERERIAAEERAKIQKERAEQAERERIEAIEKAKIEAEQAKLLAKKQAEEAAEKAKQEEIAKQKAEEERLRLEQEKREANRRHVGNIRREAKEDLMAIGLDESTAKKIVMSIDKGAVRNLSIIY